MVKRQAKKKKKAKMCDPTAPKRAAAKGPFICYALQNKNHGQTYTGQTNNWARRLRQHNGEIKGGARTTTRMGVPGSWSPVFHVVGFETLRSVLQFELAMKRRKVPHRFVPGASASAAEARVPKDRTYTRGPSGRVRQLEYLLALGRLNEEAHSHFQENGIKVQCHVSMKRYLELGNMTMKQFSSARGKQGVAFQFV